MKTEEMNNKENKCKSPKARVILITTPRTQSKSRVSKQFLIGIDGIQNDNLSPFSPLHQRLQDLQDDGADNLDSSQEDYGIPQFALEKGVANAYTTNVLTTDVQNNEDISNVYFDTQPSSTGMKPEPSSAKPYS